MIIYLVLVAGAHYDAVFGAPGANDSGSGVAATAFIPGVKWLDYRSFWNQGYPAVMITDTAPYRFSYYHMPQDTPDKVDYDKLVHVFHGFERMLEDLLWSKE